jgi:hypothetical protein
MHSYKIIARIYLVLSISNLVLAAPVVVQRIDEARGGDLEMGIVGNGATMPYESGDVDSVQTASASDWAASRPPSPDAMTSPEHSPPLDGMSSGYPTPHISESSSVSGNSWMLDRKPRLSVHDPMPSNLASPDHPEASLEEDVSFLTKVKKIIKPLAVFGTAVGGTWFLNKLRARDCQDVDRGGYVSTPRCQVTNILTYDLLHFKGHILRLASSSTTFNIKRRCCASSCHSEGG